MFTKPFIQAQIKENIKAPRHWPLCGNSSLTGEFPAQRTSSAEKVSIWWRHREPSGSPSLIRRKSGRGPIDSTHKGPITRGAWSCISLYICASLYRYFWCQFFIAVPNPSSKVMAEFFRHRNQHDAFIQFAQLLVDLWNVCWWWFLRKIYGLWTLTRCAPGSKHAKGDMRNFFNIKFEHSRWFHGVKFEIFKTLFSTHWLNLVQISWRLASLLQNHSRESVGHCVRLSAMHATVMAAFIDPKSTWCTHPACIHFGRCTKYMQLVNSCKLYENQADRFYAANAWTDISEKLKSRLCSRDAGALIHWIMCFLD